MSDGTALKCLQFDALFPEMDFILDIQSYQSLYLLDSVRRLGHNKILIKKHSVIILVVKNNVEFCIYRKM